MEMSSPESLTRSQKVFTMVGTLLGLLLAALDQTIVATAGPEIQKDLAIEPALYVWITTAYLVASTVLVPIYGKLSDLFGRRRILLIAIGIFLTGSLLCGISQSAGQLIAFRAVQGIGSAGLFTSAFAVVADLFPPAERGKYQGIFGAAFGLSSVIGPLMGGFITDNFGWHWTFFINLPLGAVAIAFIVAKMPPLRREHEVRPKLDIAGALALATFALPLLLALSFGHAEGAATPGATGMPWLSWQILGLFGLSAIGLVGFVLIERRAASPILDLRLFKIKTFAIGSLAAFVTGAAFLGAIVFLPLFMVNVVGASATSSGLTTVPLTFGIVTANILAGQMVSKLGSYKGLLVGALAIMVIGFALLLFTIDTEATQLGVSAKMVILGIGLGPGIPLFTLAIQNAVAPSQIGVATAAATFFRQMGATVGLAIIGTVFATSFSSGMKHAGPAAFEAVFTDALLDVFLVSLLIAALALVITLFLPSLPLRKAPIGARPPPAE
jgi:EmrB/QacA subfamily drug resistance transporter